MNVLKCKECISHIEAYRYHKTKTHHYCQHQNVDSGAYARDVIPKLIPSGNLSTSPKWCPKRLEIQKDGKK